MKTFLRHSGIRFFLCALLSMVYSGLFAQSDSEFPNPPNPPRLVNDLAKCMSADQVAELEKRLVDFDKTTSTQISVVTVTSIGNYEVAQYAVELANRWKIGRAAKDNGVLVFAAIGDRKINISTGYGLEGALPDAVCGRIIRNEIVPSFRSEKYYEGFSKAVDAIIKATKGEYTAEPEAEGDLSAGKIFLIVFVVLIVIIIIGAAGGGNGGGDYMSGRGSRGWGGPFLGGGWGSGSGWSSGGSGWGGGSSGGGFGGFGGGSFGGGGASGSW